MFEISRILAPVVFSDNCRGALQYAASLASRFDAELTVLHVLEPLTCLDFDTTGGLQNVDEARRAWVHRSLQELGCSLRPRVSLRDVCVEGEPSQQIVRFAEACDASLIVIATHGHGPFRRFLLGSVTAKVLHDAQCAVWTGAHLERALASPVGSDEIRSIVCAVDCGPQTDPALEWSAGIATAYDAPVTVVHVLPPEHDPERRRKSCEHARLRLEGWLAQYPGRAQCQITSGSVVEEIVEAVRRSDAGLLVIGRGHMQGGGRLRSTSYAILREAPCPVVSV